MRSPIFEIAPSFCLPPVECWRGVSPTQAAKSRPLAKVSGGGARAAIAVAVIGPMPGIVISRRATSSSRARRTISLSRTRDLPIEQRQAVEQHRATSRGTPSGSCRSRSRSSSVGELVHMRRALRRDPAIFRHMAADRVDDLGPLPHQQSRARNTSAAACCSSLFTGHEPHARPLRRLADRLGIRRIVLLPLHERLAHRPARSAGPRAPACASSRAQ